MQGSAIFTFNTAPMATVLVSGGTGLIGKALQVKLLEKGYEVIVLTRQLPEKPPDPRIRFATWNVAQQTIDPTVIAQADYIIHLAGAGVADKRWNAARKKVILESRTQSSQLLVNALRQTPNKVKAFISASATGWYGEDTSRSRQSGFEETEPPANDFLGQTCYQWEQSVEPVTELGIRLVKLRTGIVLSKAGGALKAFMLPVRFGVAAILGNGRQHISWIHIADIVNLYLFALENPSINGSYNAVGPHPCTNATLIKTLARVMHGRFYIPIKVPAFILKTALGEMSIEVLKSATASHRKTAASGFTWQYPELERALRNLLGR